MNKNRLIIIGLVIVIIALLVGIAISVLAPAKKDVKLTIINNDTIFEGDSIKVKLTDVNDTRIANETVNITITDENGTTDNYSVVTNENGIGVLKLNKSAGNYTINCTFSGNENYTGNSTFQMLKIIKQINQHSGSSSSQGDNRPAVDSEGITQEEADYYGWYYTPDHGGHYIGPNDAWDDEAGVYHD